MRDFFLNIGKGEMAKLDRSLFPLDSYKEYSYKYKNFTFYGIYSKENIDSLIFEDEDIFLTIYGKIFTRYDTNQEINGFITANKLNKLMNDYSNFYNKIKGNFLIIKYNKETNELIILSDQLGIRPVYYGQLDGDFIVTSNLFLLNNYEIHKNNRVFLENILFGYPITNETYIKNIFFIDNGFKFIYRNNNLIKEKLFDLKDFIFNDSMNKFDFNTFLKIFNDSVVKRANVSKNKLCPLTGGFDGRSLVSTLINKDIDFKSYSFGKKNGENTIIPMKIKEILGINYEPIYLENEYEKMYTSFSLKAIYHSDGLSDFERANYPYALNKFFYYSNYVITGLIGGEVFGPVHLIVDYINEYYYNYIYRHSADTINNYLKNCGIFKYLNKDLVNRYKKTIYNILNSRKEIILSVKNNKFGYLNYLYDLMSLGFKRFYGSEIHTVRFYMENLTAMFDLDLIEYLLSTSHKKIYKKAFRESRIWRINNRKLQAKIIRRNSPRLANIKVDRNFTPNDLLNPLKLITIPFKINNRISKEHREFTSDHWSEIFYNHILKNDKYCDEELINLDNLFQFIVNYKPAKYNKKINKLISLSIFSRKLFK